MLRNTNYLIFILVQLVVSGMMQFYFLGTGQFMQDRGISGKNVSAAMGIAQAVQAAATILLARIGSSTTAGFQWTFVIGALCWTVLFAIYVVSKQSLGIMLDPGVPRSGLRVFHDRRADVRRHDGPEGDRRLGPIADLHRHQRHRAVPGDAACRHRDGENSVGGKFQWPKIWAVPLAITLAGAIVFAAAFKVPSPKDFQKEKPRTEKAVAVARV